MSKMRHIVSVVGLMLLLCLPGRLSASCENTMPASLCSPQQTEITCQSITQSLPMLPAVVDNTPSAQISQIARRQLKYQTENIFHRDAELSLAHILCRAASLTHDIVGSLPASEISFPFSAFW